MAASAALPHDTARREEASLKVDIPAMMRVHSCSEELLNARDICCEYLMKW